MGEITTESVDTPKPVPKMRSVRYHGPRDIRLDEIDEPECKKGQVKLSPAYVGLCGTGKLPA